MSSMKRLVLPILEEIAVEPGTRMQVFNRVNNEEEGLHPSLNLEWGRFKRIWGMLKDQGAIEPEPGKAQKLKALGKHTITAEGKEWISD